MKKFLREVIDWKFNFIRTDSGYRVTAPEGFVATDKIGNVVKLVDRLEFSRANFTIAKDWVKG